MTYIISCASSGKNESTIGGSNGDFADTDFSPDVDALEMRDMTDTIRLPKRALLFLHAHVDEVVGIENAAQRSEKQRCR